MMSGVNAPRLGCEFDRFLYASVGEGNNGMPLTVLSALARTDVDPWEEASRLTQLPQESAVTQLASLLRTLKNTPVADLDPARIAGPLIALLPRPRDRAPRILKDLAPGARPWHRAAVSTLFTVFVYLTFMLLSQWLMGRLQVPRQIRAQPSTTSGPAIDSPSARTSSEGPRLPTK